MVLPDFAIENSVTSTAPVTRSIVPSVLATVDSLSCEPLNVTVTSFLPVILTGYSDEES